LLSLIVGKYHRIDLLPHRRLLRDALCLPRKAWSVKTTVAED